MKKYAYIVGRSDGSLEMVDCDVAYIPLDVLRSAIGGGIVEVVSPRFVTPEWADLRIVCDDNGLYKRLPENVIATSLYSMGAQPLVGDVVYCRLSFDDDFGADLSAFLREDALRLLRLLSLELE